jgi:hypothetical protein
MCYAWALYAEQSLILHVVLTHQKCKIPGENTLGGCIKIRAGLAGKT